MWLLIDDERDLGCDVIARTPEAAKKLIPLKCWETICFDHDLGHSTETTGYDLLSWAAGNNYLPNHIQLVTSNPIGQDRMIQVLNSYGYSGIDRCNFYQKQ